MNAQSQIHLNVGGKPFVTTVETLSAGGANWFTNQLGADRAGAAAGGDAAASSTNRPLVGSAEAPLFVDRDARRFAVLLNFLRTKRVALDGLPLLDLLEEATYFGVSALRNARLEVCAVECVATDSSSALSGQFTVRGHIDGAKSARESHPGDFAACELFVANLVNKQGWTVDSITLREPQMFFWTLTRVAL